MKRCDYVTAHGYPVWEDGEKEPTIVLPSWLPPGKHKISITRLAPHGMMVKTDRMPRWIHHNWFRPV